MKCACNNFNDAVTLNVAFHLSPYIRQSKRRMLGKIQRSFETSSLKSKQTSPLRVCSVSKSPGKLES